MAGTILHVGGNNVIDRLQSAGLGNAQMPYETIREIGDLNIVDKVPGEPDYTFSLQTLDVTTEIEAWLTGKVATGSDPSQAPGAADADGTEYPIDGVHTQFVNVTSPWRDPLSSAGVIAAGHIIPGYFPTNIAYSYGVTANASETVQLAGSTYYFNESAPVEQYEAGDGAQTDFPTSDAAVSYREGGFGGTTFRSVFGVTVNGVLQAKGVDYTDSASTANPGVTTVSFMVAPPAGADIRFCYFTTAARNYPMSLNASAIVKPAAVRGRNICVFLGSGGAAVQLGGVQTAQLTYAVTGEVERELCSYEVIGYTVTGTDVTGNLVVRSRDIPTFAALLAKVTGIARTEVIGWLNTNTVPLSIKIQNPKNTGQILKTLYVSDAMFDVPDTPTQVNTALDVTFNFQSQTGTYSVYKGDSGF